jgi:type II secretory pathway predicted ATPase ExeA
MNAQKLLSRYNLKWDPFSSQIPTDALWASKPFEHFAWRMGQQVFHGGFAMVSGQPGTGKSVALRLLAARLADLRDVKVGILTRPQSQISDFYREMGDLFDVKLVPSNRYGGFRALRSRWKAHVEATLMRPVLLIDEAQEMPMETISELRLLQSADFDSVSFLCVVLCGDDRLDAMLRHPDLLPVQSRIQIRFSLLRADPDDLRILLDHLLSTAGNPDLFSQDVLAALVEHCAGNLRALMHMASDLLQAAVAAEVPRIDQKLFLDVFNPEAPRKKPRSKP